MSAKLEAREEAMLPLLQKEMDDEPYAHVQESSLELLTVTTAAGAGHEVEFKPVVKRAFSRMATANRGAENKSTAKRNQVRIVEAVVTRMYNDPQHGVFNTWSACRVP